MSVARRGVCTALVAVASAVGLLAGAGSALAEEAKFSFTEKEQEFTVPAGVTSVHVVAVGGAGGGGFGSGAGSPGGAGGLGAVVSRNLGVTAGETLYVEVGGNGRENAGGFNGGGSAVAASGGGGGASDVREVSIGAGPSPGNESSLKSRLLVAAGAGGGGSALCEPGSGGAGGNAEEGGHNGVCAEKAGGGGGAGTSTKPGAAGSPSGKEGALGAGGGSTAGGGGGGGLYGGGSGGVGFVDGGGGGGSNLGTVEGTAKTGEEPSVTFTYTLPVPTNKQQCRKGGWRKLIDSNGKPFKNQGQCVRFVEANSAPEGAQKAPMFRSEGFVCETGATPAPMTFGSAILNTPGDETTITGVVALKGVAPNETYPVFVVPTGPGPCTGVAVGQLKTNKQGNGTLEFTIPRPAGAKFFVNTFALHSLVPLSEQYESPAVKLD